MTTKFVLAGNSVHITQVNNDQVLDSLPPKVYTVCFSQAVGFYLDVVKEQLTVPTKIYGKTGARVDKCMQTYRDRKASTGLLMTGDKGTGKSLLMSLVCNKVLTELEIPVILIQEGFTGEAFTNFITSIGESCVVFDEVGKMYGARSDSDNASQDDLLGLMDGVDKTKRLIIMTENEEWDINKFMLNRPSRIYYHFRYSKLEEDSIIGYCEDREVTGTPLNDILDVSRRSAIFSFDMLQSIVEEHLRFGCSVKDSIVDLNIDITSKLSRTIKVVSVFDKEEQIDREMYNGISLVDMPEDGEWGMVKVVPLGKPAEEDVDVFEDSSGRGYDRVHFREDDIVYTTGSRIIYDSNNWTVVVDIVKAAEKDYSKIAY